MSTSSNGRHVARPSRQLSQAGRPRPPSENFAAVCGLVLLVALVGGYGFRWQWTGFADNGQLWDVLHLLLLPLAVAALPFWYRTPYRFHWAWRLALGLLAVTFAVLVVGGYALDWAWTGFQGNTLWDWLELLVLPVTVASLPLWMRTHNHRERRWQLASIAMLTVFVVLVVCGYALDWAWTGFEGNTLWDWLQLLLVPFALPIAILLYTAPAPSRAAERSPESQAEPELGPVRRDQDVEIGPVTASAARTRSAGPSST